MTPYELAKSIHQDLSAVAPRLAAALNRALLDIGEGSPLVGLGPGTHQDDAVSFQEAERIRLAGSEPAEVLVKITRMLQALEAHSPWRVIIDQKTTRDRGHLDLLYTVVRDRRL